MKWKKESIYLVIPSLILLLYLVFRLYDTSQLLFVFPLDYVNDLSSYMANIFFLADCGFHNFCPYWYNGFTSFLATAPGWYFFVYPLYFLIGSVNVASYLMLLITFLIGALVFFVGGKWINLDLRERFFYFAFFFANANAIGYFVRLGRYHEFFAWVNFVLIALALLYYKDQKIDWKYLLLIIPTTIIILTHQNVAIFAAFLFFGFILAKGKEWFKALLIPLSSFLISGFWIIPYFFEFFKTSAVEGHIYTKVLWNPSILHLFDNVAAFVVSLCFLILAFIYLKQKDFDTKEILFFSPIIFLGLIYFLRIIPFFPILKHTYIDPHNFLYLFFSLFFFLQIDWGKLKKIIPFLLILIAIGSLTINITHTAMFPEVDEVYSDIDNVLGEVGGSYLLLNNLCEEPLSPTKYYTSAIYAYGSAKYGLSTPLGWAWTIASPDYLYNIEHIPDEFTADDKEYFLELVDEYQVDEIIAMGKGCNLPEEYGLKEKFVSGDVHLYF